MSEVGGGELREGLAVLRWNRNDPRECSASRSDIGGNIFLYDIRGGEDPLASCLALQQVIEQQVLVQLHVIATEPLPLPNLDVASYPSAPASSF